MSFQPIIPQTGLAGWRFLQRTMDTQTRVFDARPDLTRDTAYFEAKIGSVDTAEKLVADRRLLRVALGAFGLQDDINNRFFIRKVLEGGVLTEGSLANRLGDERYREMSRAFGFGDLVVPSTKISDFGKKITERYRQQAFELAVGQQSESLRLALAATRDLPNLVSGPESDRTKWFGAVTFRRSKAGRAGTDLGKNILGEDAVSAESAVTTARHAADRDCWREIIRQAFALFLCRCVQQPHQHEKSHHRRNEVGISNLPRPTVVSTRYDLFPLDDDWRRIGLRAHLHHLHTHPGSGINAKVLLPS